MIARKTYMPASARKIRLRRCQLDACDLDNDLQTLPMELVADMLCRKVVDVFERLRLGKSRIPEPNPFLPQEIVFVDVWREGRQTF